MPYLNHTFIVIKFKFCGIEIIVNYDFKEPISFSLIEDHGDKSTPQLRYCRGRSIPAET